MSMKHNDHGGKKKMYKSGKMWLTAGLAATLAVSATPAAFSAETETAEQTTAISASTNGTTYTATPDNPGVPGEHVDSNDTTSPVWPDGTDRPSLTKDIYSTIHYVYKSGPKAGQTAATDHKDKVTFNRTASFEVSNTETPTEQGTVTVYYKDVDTGDIIATQDDLSGDVGATYNAKNEQKYNGLLSEGYTFDSVDGVESGNYTNGHQTVTYYFYKGGTGTGNDNGQASEGTVTVYYKDVDTGETLAAADTLTGDIGASFSALNNNKYSDLTNEGYKLDNVAFYDGNTTVTSYVENQTGTFSSADQTVTYYFYKMGSVEVGGFSAVAPFAQPMALNATIQPLAATVSPLTYTDWVALNDDNTFDAVNSPVIQGYTADVKTVPAVVDMTVDSPDFETTVYYTPNKQAANVTYIDDTTGKELAKDAFEGLSDEKMAYTTADRIADYESQGYKLVSNDYPSDATYDHDDTTDQAFVVHLTKEETPTTTSETPSEPVTPDSTTPTTPVTPASETPTTPASETPTTQENVTPSTPVKPESETPKSQISGEPATMINTVTESAGGVLPYTAMPTQTVVEALPYTATTQPTVSGVLPYTALPTTAAEKESKPWVAIGIGVATALSLFALGTFIANRRRQ